jgi:predicted peptidase
MYKLRIIIKIVASVLFLALILGCSGGDVLPEDDGADNTIRTAEDVREDFKKFNIKTGINDLVLESLIKNVFWNFRIILPEGASATNLRPLVLRLHGGAQNAAPTAHKSTACLVEPGFEGLNAIIVSPNSNQDLWYEEKNIVQVLALMDLIKANLPVEESKVVVTGYSDGGNGSWFFAQFYSNLFSAAIPMATSFRAIDNQGNVSKINIPMYVIHGSADTLFPVETTEGFVNESIAVGSDITFVVADGLVHVAACDYLPYFKDAVTWLETEVWN